MIFSSKNVNYILTLRSRDNRLMATISIEGIMRRIKECENKAADLHTGLTAKSQELHKDARIKSYTRGSTNFRVDFGDSGYALSVAVPPDMMMGYCETALLDNSGLCYMDKWGYSDVVRLGDMSNLVAEINRVCKIVCGHLS